MTEFDSQAIAPAVHCQQVLDHLADGVWSFDREWRCIYLNCQQQQWLAKRATQQGISTLEKIQGESLWDLMPDWVNTAIASQIQYAFGTQTTQQIEYFDTFLSNWFICRIYPSAGGVSLFTQAIAPPLAPSGELCPCHPYQFLEDSLKSAQHRIFNLVEGFMDAFVSFDHAWRYTYVNRAAAQLLGRSPQELLGKTWQEIFPEVAQSQAFDVQQLYRAARERVSVRFEIFSQAINCWLEESIFPTSDGVAVFFRDISDRKRLEAERQQVEAALRQSEERLNVALKSTPITLFNQDRDLRYTWIYNVALEFQDADILGRCDRDFLSPQEADFLTQIKQQVLDSGQGTREEVRVERQGKILYFDLTIEPLRNPQNEVVGITCATVDISEAKRVEVALRRSESVLQAFFATSPIGLALLDRDDLRYLYVNETLANINGLPLADHLNQPLPEVLPAWADQLVPILRQVVATREPLLNQEFSGETYPPGVHHHSLVNFFPVCLPEGEVLGVGITAIEITELKRIESALRESEAQARARAEELQTFMDTVPVAVWIAQDPHCHGMIANRAACALVNQEPGDILTATPADGHYPFEFKIQREGQDIPLDELPMQRAGRTGQSVEAEFDFVFPNGRARAIYGRAVPLWDSQGQVRGVIGAFVDLTERKRVEAEREHWLQRERLAREQAETANRIKDEFLAVLSHELRSPLNPILGWTKLLRTRQFDAAATARALETIERNAKLQAQLIEDLLDVSRILQGKMTLNIAPVNLAAVIEASLETVHLSAQAKGIEIEKVFEPNVGLVSGDAGRLQQVVWNLLSNAVKFTPEGQQIEVRLSRVGRLAQIQVQDTGRGIKPEFLPHVFDYFRQEDGTTTRKFGGLGLGLAIVRHLVELHGGTVSVNSGGEDLGATFTVQLPLRAIAIPEIPPPESESPTLSLSQVNVLIVDDEPDMRELARVILEEAGALVWEASSAIAALKLLEQEAVDVVVSDIGMPDMDGFSFIQQVRCRTPEFQAVIPAIALTAYAGEANQTQALQAGYQKHLSKPVEPEVLLQAIADLILPAR